MPTTPHRASKHAVLALIQCAINARNDTASLRISEHSRDVQEEDALSRLFRRARDVQAWLPDDRARALDRIVTAYRQVLRHGAAHRDVADCLLRRLRWLAGPAARTVVDPW